MIAIQCEDGISGGQSMEPVGLPNGQWRFELSRVGAFLPALQRKFMPGTFLARTRTGAGHCCVFGSSSYLYNFASEAVAIQSPKRYA